MWLMDNMKLTREKAYKIAVGEFYQVRISEEIEQRIALEEGLAYDLTFEKTEIQSGLELETAVIEEARQKAELVVKAIANRRADANETVESMTRNSQ